MGTLLASYLRRFMLGSIEFLRNFLVGGFLFVHGGDGGLIEILRLGAVSVILWWRGQEVSIGDLARRATGEVRNTKGTKRTVK